MEFESLTFLRSERGLTLLAELASEDLKSANTLSLVTRLRKHYTAEEASAALELASLRQKAVDKFGDSAVGMWLTREALEQASHPAVRAYRANRFRTTSTAWFDMCCGIGSDALAFAAAGLTVIGIDLDPLRVELARLNNDALGLNAQFEVEDATVIQPPTDSAVFFDPARRANDRRLFNVEAYLPPLSTVRHWKQQPVRVKLSPGVDLAQLAPYGGQVEFISVDGDLKEALLYLEAGQPQQEVTLSATLLTEDGQVYRWTASGDADAEASLSDPRTWLIEPDPALLRANRVQDAAAQFQAYQLDETIAYLTGDDAPQTPWARSWRVLDWMPFNLKRLRTALRDQDVGRVTVKKRGSPLTPEQLMAQLKLKGGSQARTLVLTKLRGQPIVIICEEHPLRQDKFS